jgi:hypothetical protein
MFSKRWHKPLGLVLLIALYVCVIFPAGQSRAGITTQRSVVLSSGVPSAVANHLFNFTLPSTADIGSIVFEYCSNSPLIYFPCTPPPGLNVNAASLSSQSGNIGFSIDNADTTSNVIVLSRGVGPGNLSPSSYLFTNITNPSTPGQSVFVRIWTHASTDGSGPKIDGGAAAFAVQSIFNIGAFVPPFLKLCVGLTVAPDCSTMSGDSIDFGILSPNRVSFGQSQFATATNDPNGYVIYALGTTMTSGNNTIPALSSPSPSFPGTGQFGLNLRANLIPTIGQDPVGLGTGLPSANYNIPDRYMFNDGDSITSSNLSSDYNRMTASYIVNIPSKQAPGIYATTITYVATVEF